MHRLVFGRSGSGKRLVRVYDKGAESSRAARDWINLRWYWLRWGWGGVYHARETQWRTACGIAIPRTVSGAAMLGFTGDECRRCMRSLLRRWRRATRGGQ